MSPLKPSKHLSATIDFSNNSVADILASPSDRFSCQICKETETTDELAEFCLCESFIHQQCIAKVIDKWMEDGVGQSTDDGARTEAQKPYVCQGCKSQVFYKSRQQIQCKNGSQICSQFKRGPIKSFFQLFFFFLGLAILIFGILVKSGKYCLQIGLNQLTVSVITIGVIIIALLMLLVSFYYIFIEILTDKKRRVDKVYQKRKKGQRRETDSVNIIQVGRI